MEANKSVTLRPFTPENESQAHSRQEAIFGCCAEQIKPFFCQESTIDCSVLTRLTREYCYEGNILIESGNWKECRRNKPLNIFFPVAL